MLKCAWLLVDTNHFCHAHDFQHSTTEGLLRDPTDQTCLVRASQSFLLMVTSESTFHYDCLESNYQISKHWTLVSYQSRRLKKEQKKEMKDRSSNSSQRIRSSVFQKSIVSSINKSVASQLDIEGINCVSMAFWCILYKHQVFWRVMLFLQKHRASQHVWFSSRIEPEVRKKMVVKCCQALNIKFLLELHHILPRLFAWTAFLPSLPGTFLWRPANGWRDGDGKQKQQ